MSEHDLVIIGAGPAGLTAAIYSSRAGLAPLVVERQLPGGQMGLTYLIENFPGFPEGAAGVELAERMRQQAERFGAEFRMAAVDRIRPGEGGIELDLEGEPLRARALIVATGARWRALGVPGEREFLSRGVSYCATCDGPLYRGQPVAVVGGSDHAVEEALFLARYAEPVYLIHRRDQLRATQVLQREVLSNDKVTVLWNTVVTEIVGADAAVRALNLRNVATGEESTLEVPAVFVCVGTEPVSEVAAGVLELDDKGYIVVDADLRASVPGIYAAGDVRSGAWPQVVTACADGALASRSAERYLQGLEV
ncbi:MAG: thioredoxin-disulfide reductase [Armatimonadota bacterium]|nr:MAG: thioredoxin-disulfide reductase [Armatimonadota bacterium]